MNAFLETLEKKSPEGDRCGRLCAAFQGKRLGKVLRKVFTAGAAKKTTHTVAVIAALASPSLKAAVWLYGAFTGAKEGRPAF